MPSPQTRSQTGSADKSVATILVVEDDVLIRLALADYLRDCGYRVFEAISVAEAKAVLNADTPVALVFSDVDLSGEENGFTLASWIRQHHPDTKVLLTSGLARTAEKAGDLCDEGPMPKPYTYEAVLQRIQTLLRKNKETGPQ